MAIRCGQGLLVCALAFGAGALGGCSNGNSGTPQPAGTFGSSTVIHNNVPPEPGNVPGTSYPNNPAPPPGNTGSTSAVGP